MVFYKGNSKMKFYRCDVCKQEIDKVDSHGHLTWRMSGKILSWDIHGYCTEQLEKLLGPGDEIIPNVIHHKKNN